MKVVLGGNPNSGKTTLFNALTGSNQYVGNWPGVTVEKKEGKLKQDKSITLTDLPGIYSLSPYTLEEVVARNVLLNEEIDVIINIVDASNLERNLYLTTQLLELDIPVVIALNMMDIVNKNGDKIDIKALQKRLGCLVVQISALKQEGLDDLLKALKLAAKPKKTYNFTADVEKAIREVQAKEKSNRFIAIKYLEKDEKVLENSDHNYNDLSDILSSQFDDDVESIITNERYEVISDILNDCYVKKHEGLSVSDKIDRIVTNRILGLPIFALIMFVVYYLSITTVGSMATDWVNDVLFPEIIQANVVSFLEGLNVAEWLVSLINDGIIGGVGAVLGFVPQMLVLFFLLAFLEGCGYMARVAFVMDRIFRKFNLSGKSFIPMLIGTGCGVPAIMATRTIENDSDRKMTIMTTTFIPCSAKLPIIGLIAGALFDNAGWVATSAYFVGMAAIIVSGIILKKTKLFAGETSPFVMELPSYHMPTLSTLLKSTWQRGYAFIKKAGTIILLSTIVIWFLSSFGFENGQFTMVEDLNNGLLASIGNAISFIFVPIGFGTWDATVATITGLVAKENVVGTMGVLYGLAEVSENGEEIWSMFASNFTQISAYSFLIFNLLCAPCFAAMGAIKKEMNNSKWFMIAIGYQTVFAYAVSLCVYRIGELLINQVFDIWTVIALVVLIGFIYFFVRKDKYSKVDD